MTLGHGSANQANTAAKRQPPTNATQVTISSQSAALSTNTNISSIDGTAIALGQTTSSSSFPVVIASDQTSLITQPNVVFAVSGTSSTTANISTLLLPGVASKQLYITAISISNSSATAVLINFEDGSGGTVLWSYVLPAGSTVTLGSFIPMFKTSSGNGLYFQSSAAVITIYANAAGFVQ